MPLFSRIFSICLRIGEIAFGAAVAGIIGHYLRLYSGDDVWPEARWIYTEVIAGLSILLGLLFLIPFAAGFSAWPLDVILSLAWFAAFGALVDMIHRLGCGGIWDWGFVRRRGICPRLKAAEAFSFLSAIFWSVSGLVMILNHAMIRDPPFCIEDCIRVAEKSAQDLKRGGDDPECSLLRLLLTNADPTQVPHLLDWCIVNGTCRRFRRLGKEAFSQKVFGMSRGFARGLQRLEVKNLSADDQRTALKYISSIIFLEAFVTAGTLSTLPRCVSAFPRLKTSRLHTWCGTCIFRSSRRCPVQGSRGDFL
ncbi:hypothetical protein VTN02DRAFT_1883 [Thermoascus thermophilus]